MSFRPQGALEDWMPAELLFKAKYLCEQEPSEVHLQAYQEALSKIPSFSNSIQRSRDGLDQYEEDIFFQENHPLSVVKHPRYLPAGWHSHDFFELIYVCQGGCDNLLKAGTLHMEAGDFCILPPNQSHAIACNRDDGLIINVLIRKSAFRQSFNLLLSDFDLISVFFSHTLYQKQNSAYLMFRCGKNPIIRGLVEEMYKEYVSDKPFSAAVLSGQLMMLLGRLMRDHQFDVLQVQRTGKEQTAKATRILQYISDHLQTVTLGDVAQEFNYSRSRCSNIIRESTGKTFSEILREEKSHRAAKLLQETNRTMTSIAEELGFFDISHFYKTFSSVYGVTPANYRKDHHD